MAAIGWTATIPESENFTLNYRNRLFRADSGKNTVVEYGNPYWVTELSFNALTLQQERELSSMLGALRGMYGTIKIPSWTRKRTDNLGTIQIQSATNNSFTMTVSAPSAFSQKIFSKGDYISFADEMFEVISDVTTNGIGLGSVTLNKRLRNTYASGTIIEYLNPYCIMRMSDDNYSLSRSTVISNSTITFEEAFSL